MSFPIACTLPEAVVTVVMPSYNHSKYVVDAIESVRQQTLQNWRLLILDDGSTDSSMDILNQHARQVDDHRIEIIQQTNAGSHATLNRGLSMASTKYVAVLNSDDRYARDRLEKLVQLADSRGGDVFIATGIRLIDEDGLPASEDHWWLRMYRELVQQWGVFSDTEDFPSVQTLMWGNFTVSTSNFFLSRALWERVGLFKHLRYVPDWDFALRVAAEFPDDFIFLPDAPLMDYRLHGQNTILGGALRNHAEALRVLRTFQRKWVSQGHCISGKAVDRLHYLSRFIRHEHARQQMEKQKSGWVEQVRAVRHELDMGLEKISSLHHQLNQSHDETHGVKVLLEKTAEDLKQSRAQTVHSQQETRLARDDASQARTQAEQAQVQAEQAQVQAEQAQVHERLAQTEANLARADMEQAQTQERLARDESIRSSARADSADERARLARDEATRAHAHATGLEQQLHLILSSRSWKLTSPLRKFNLLMQSTKQVSVEVAKKGVEKVRSEMRGPSGYGQWLEGEQDMLRNLQAQSKNIIESLPHKPLVSIVMPVHDAPAQFLGAAIDSVLAQWYPRWELCICDDASRRVETLDLLARIQKTDSRVRMVRRQEAGHIVLATNDAIEIAVGELVVFLDHDDQLAPQALMRLVQTLNEKPEVDFIYSDEDKLDADSTRCLPFFKPDWSPVLLWSQNYIGHIMCIRRGLLNQIGRLHSGTQGSQDHDLMLRLASHGAKVEHLPEVLYHWQMHEGSTSASADSKPYAHTAGKEAVSRHLASKYPDHFDCVEDSDYTFVYKARFKVPANTLTSIIIPTRDHAQLLRECIDSIRRETVGMRFEIIILDNGSREPETLELFGQLQSDADTKVVEADIPFNWSALNNLGRRHAKGEVLVFLNNDTLVISPDWLVRLAEYALLPDVATVGAMLLYPDGTIQHAGVVVGMGGWADHVFKGASVTHFPSPFVSSVLPRNVLASTGACVAMSTSQFDALGGFDEAFQICGSDVEMGLRAHKRGLHNVYLADVRLYHLESKTRSSFVPQNDFEQSELKYAPYRTQGDPFFNPNLDPMSASPTPRYPAPLADSNRG